MEPDAPRGASPEWVTEDLNTLLTGPALKKAEVPV